MKLSSPLLKYTLFSLMAFCQIEGSVGLSQSLKLPVAPANSTLLAPKILNVPVPPLHHPLNNTAPLAQPEAASLGTIAGHAFSIFHCGAAIYGYIDQKFTPSRLKAAKKELKNKKSKTAYSERLADYIEKRYAASQIPTYPLLATAYTIASFLALRSIDGFITNSVYLPLLSNSVSPQGFNYITLAVTLLPYSIYLYNKGSLLYRTTEWLVSSRPFQLTQKLFAPASTLGKWALDTVAYKMANKAQTYAEEKGYLAKPKDLKTTYLAKDDKKYFIKYAAIETAAKKIMMRNELLNDGKNLQQINLELAQLEKAQHEVINAQFNTVTGENISFDDFKTALLKREIKNTKQFVNKKNYVTIESSLLEMIRLIGFVKNDRDRTSQTVQKATEKVYTALLKKFYTKADAFIKTFEKDLKNNVDKENLVNQLKKTIDKALTDRGLQSVEQDKQTHNVNVENNLN